jgi:hypothetical protein
VPVGWEYRGAVLVLSFTGVVEREDIEGALDGALSDPRCRPALGLLWDARRSETPVSADDIAWRFDLVSSLADRGLVSRAALLVSSDWSLMFEHFRFDMQRAFHNLQVDAFTDDAAALAWLERGALEPPTS